MLSNPDSFIPFLLDQDFTAYCQEIKDKSVWGGQLEITAICWALKIQVWVYQAGDLNLLKFGEEGEVLKVSYHRFSYGLGEHYNSLVEVKPVS